MKTPSTNPQDENPVRVIDASSAATGQGSMHLTPEDVMGLMGMRYAKCQIAPARPGFRWRMILVVQRQGLPALRLMEYGLGSNPDPFFLACKWPGKGATEVDFYHAYNWQVTFCDKLTNPVCTHMGLRGTHADTPLTAGKWVVMLWSNITGKSGWEPDDNDFVQRVVLDLSEVPTQVM